MTTLSHPAIAESLPTETLLGWLRDMYLIREFEIRTMQAYQNKKIGGFCHVYIGQEAVAVGCVAATRNNDPLVTAYRDHGHGLARGMAPKYGMAEMFGKLAGCAKGKGGSMHFFDAANAMYGGHGIVGAQTPLGAGLAFATKYEDEVIGGAKSDKVTLCFLGDGAVNQGAFHEAMNLAGLFDLPVIFIVENNGYSMGTAIERGTTMAHDLGAKARANGIDHITIQGMDVMSVYDGMKPFVDQCRENSRPGFVDMQTYRFKGHSMSDPRKYRTKDEEAQYEAQDPIGRLEQVLKSQRDVVDADMESIYDAQKKIVREAVEFAENAPAPGLDELYKDVYVEPFGPWTGTSLPEMLANDPNYNGGAR